MKKLRYTLITICIMMSFLFVYSISASAESGYEYDDKTKTLTIYSDVSENEDLWIKYGEQAERLIIGTGVTNLSQADFSYFTNISQIVVEKGNKNYIADAQGLLLSKDETVLIMCADAKTIRIPATVTTITKDAFASCTSLKSIDVDNDNPKYSCDEFGVLYNKDKTMLIQYPDEREAESYVIPETVVVIYDSAFEDCDNLKGIVIPDSVVSIGESAFEDCDGLLTLTLGNNLTSIGAYAFLDCTEITELIIPDSVTELGEGAFEDCTGLVTVTIGNGLEIISESAFEDCDEIKNLSLGENIVVIGEYAFYDCHSIEELIIPDSVVKIGEGTFEDISNLKSIIFGKNVKKIGECAFEDCGKLKSVILPESVAIIGESAFFDCSSLESIVIGKNISSVGVLTFSGCYKLSNFYYTGSYTEWKSMPIELRSFVSVMQVTVYYNCSPVGEVYRFAINTPSRYTIRYKDGIVLHTIDNGLLPDNTEVKWLSSDKNFVTESSINEKNYTIISQYKGYTTITAIVYDAEGSVLATDTIIMYSKVGFFDVLSGVIRSFLGITRIYEK